VSGPSPELLRSASLFAELDDATLAQLAGDFVARDFPEGAVLAEEGQGGLNFFVVESGEASISVGGVDVGSLGPGGAFGEIALVDKSARTATIRATTPMRTYALPIWSFRSFVETRPHVAWRLLEILAERLRAAEAR
jgi:CRP-like cAMP-binding protein